MSNNPHASFKPTPSSTRILGLIAVASVFIAALFLALCYNTPPTQTEASGTQLTYESAQNKHDQSQAQHHRTRTAARAVQPLDDQDDSAQDDAPASSLRGSEVDAEFHFDQSGQLIADLSLRRYFDYFLTTIGELSLAEIRAALAADLAQRLDPAQGDQAQRVLERYLEYLAAAQALSPAANPTDRLEQLFELRRQLLGQEIAAGFFAQEEQYTRTVLAEQAILQQADLSLSQRQEHLAQLHQDLPPELRASREQTVAHHLALEQQRQFEQLQLDVPQRHAERAALYGEAAAHRLDALDQQRQAWQRRLNTYQQQRESLLAQGTDAAAVDALRTQLFDSAEQRRVQALEILGFPDADQN